MTLPVYIGFDSREPRTWEVARRSLIATASAPVLPIKLDSTRLAERGLLRRPQDTRGQRYDLHSNAYASTEFAISRFLVPILNQQGLALFVDGDVVFLEDIHQLVTLVTNHPLYDKTALWVVQHKPIEAPKVINDPSLYKMDGQRQQFYSRKNWSSVMLFNCDHPAHKRLSLADVRERRGLDLHNFYWLNDSEIGPIPARWNWLVGVNEKPDDAAIAHFTLGTPEMGVRSPYDTLWTRYAPPAAIAATA